MANLDVIIDVVVVDLLGCASLRSKRDAKTEQNLPLAERRTYSYFDALAGCAMGFMYNMCITVVVPMTLSSVESRDHPSPLAGSGAVAATSSIGMSLSVLFMYQMSAAVLDSKTPFYIFAVLLLCGNTLFLVAEVAAWPLPVLLAARVLMALGFGASFVAKRRAGVVEEAQPKVREGRFMALELFNSIGMASGPLLSGLLAVVVPGSAVAEALWPPLLMMALAIAFLITLASTPLDAPLPPSASPRPHEATPLVSGGGDCARPSFGGGTNGGGAASAVSATTANADAAVAVSRRPPPLWASYVAQLTCLLFGVSRTFLKFGFESAMVVVYDRQFFFSQGGAGVVAGCCALSTVSTHWLYRGTCKQRLSTHRLLAAAEVFALASAALMIATSLLPLSHAHLSLADAAAITHGDVPPPLLPLLLTVGASMLFYPAMYLGAAIGNSHPMQFAVPGHPLLSRNSMAAQQAVVQTTLGNGLGMFYCRVALGNPPRLASLGRLFAAVMVLQSVMLALGFEPEATRDRFSKLWSSRPRRGMAQGSR